MYIRNRLPKSVIESTQMIKEILERKESNLLFSFVIGLGIAVLLFHRSRKNYVVSAVDADTLHNTIANKDGKCYRYRVMDASEPST